MTGSKIPGRPGLAVWLSHGLGNDTDNLSSFVVMASSDKGKTCGQLYFAWNIVADKVDVQDILATILHLCGIDDTRLTFRYQGRQSCLTDVHGEVVQGIIAG